MNSSYEKPCNIGNDRVTSIGELATMVSEKVAKKTGRDPVDIVFAARPEDDPYRRQPDITVAKKELGWQPTVTLEEGLDRTIDWYVDLLKMEQKNTSEVAVNGDR